MRLIIVLIIVIFSYPAFADYEAGKRAYDAGDYEAAYNEWLPLAEAGDANTQHKIGYFYASGIGVDIDLVMAQKWYLRAAKQGKASSQFSIAIILLQGKLSKRYIIQGYCWLTVSHMAGYIEAEVILNNLKEKDETIPYFKKAESLRKKGHCTIAPLN